MRIAVSITGPDDIRAAEESGASIIEVRLDLFPDVNQSELTELLKESRLPVILTLRSTKEGGRFPGTPEEWFDRILPFIENCDYVDIEMRYADYARDIRESGKIIVASSHLSRMPSMEELVQIECDLRNYGELPKIIVTPGCNRDLIRLLEFTENAEKPIITGVMGSEYRYGRILCSLFGSDILYCRLDTPAAEGQYTVTEASGILSMLH